MEQKLDFLSEIVVNFGEITEKELIDFGMPDHLSLMSDLNFLTVGEPLKNIY